MSKTIDQLADEHEAYIFKENPNGFTCAPYCNGDFLSDAFLKGAAAQKALDKERLEKAEAALRFYADKENWNSCHLPGSGLGNMVFTKKDAASFDYYGYPEQGGKLAQAYFAKYPAEKEGT